MQLEKRLNDVEIKDTGIICPQCNCPQTAVIDSREAKIMGEGSVRRRRQCLRCSFRWRTYEVSAAALKELREIINERLRVRL